MFTPYVIRNYTGSPISFIPITVSPSQVGTDSQRIHGQKMDDVSIHSSSWRDVAPNEEVPFQFLRREKIRHKVLIWIDNLFLKILIFQLIRYQCNNTYVIFIPPKPIFEGVYGSQVVCSSICPFVRPLVCSFILSMLDLSNCWTNRIQTSQIDLIYREDVQIIFWSQFG